MDQIEHMLGEIEKRDDEKAAIERERDELERDKERLQQKVAEYEALAAFSAHNEQEQEPLSLLCERESDSESELPQANETITDDEQIVNQEELSQSPPLLSPSTSSPPPRSIVDLTHSTPTPGLRRSTRVKNGVRLFAPCVPPKTPDGGWRPYKRSGGDGKEDVYED